MFITLTDIIILFGLLLFTSFGLFFGFIHTLGSVVGALLGVFLSSRWTRPLAEKYGFLLGGGNIAQVIIFLVLFIGISRLIGLIFWFFDRFYRILHLIPFMKTINKGLGGVLGFIEGIIIIGVSLFYITVLIDNPSVIEAIEDSGLAQWMLDLTRLLHLMIPE